MNNLSLGADGISTNHGGKQLIVVLLPDDNSEEKAFLEQGTRIHDYVCEGENNFWNHS